MVAIVDYNAGNTRSLQFALDRLGVNSSLTSNIEEIQSAEKIIFPGQGAALNAMQNLKKTGLDKIIPNLKQPVLGICLGMQLLCRSTEEGNIDCLDIISTDVKKISNKVKVPHMGWNNISNLKSQLFNNVIDNEFMYLVHSFYVPIIPETIAESNYNGFFSVAIQKNNFYGVQFHPEKSSKPGIKVLENFLTI